ncbi:hypothetical protein HO173_004932 [Letharia columbiana]|uniref:Mediator of RNA polymerase II transcription subunit 12 n=1 Tax=Letharia columbiana TaxID=112416 RepID=A0A8H6L680_9LECA|nr:uncharacterized protein HO173_004932 [Letharia columbiana]KAF6237053.1 hypothetical protein HO173_004932 [Letharia columbiana]
MTSNLAGIEPPLLTGNRSFQLPPTRTASHDLQQTSRTWPRQTFNPTPNAPPSSQDASEPASKRQKTGDPATESIGKTSGILRSVLDISTAISEKGRPLIKSADFLPGKESADKEQQPSLFPTRPGKNPQRGGNQQGRALAIERATARDVVPVKPYVPEPPSFAPRFHKAGPADFFPWTGCHAEDVLNELTTRQGFYDKSPVSQNESNTARPSVWSSLKHKSGLQILSSLFVSALDQRQIHGTITTNTTFKPPPRVTLTDTKREAWLRDLANPSIPLRRLSRTIPHGIRGKILLDHCLSKDIPTFRAIWLVKCVGANEIRAFKRKGTGGVFTVGGEAKWIKDWTANVEQFLESIVGLCGSADWRSKINYGLRLITHLYSEHLLDRDHYLDWLIVSFRDSDLDALPMWLLVMQIHQQDILQHRQRGRRLAEALSKHLDKASLTTTHEVYDTVFKQLAKLLKTVMLSAPACFILPACWSKYGDAIKRCLDKNESRLQSTFDSLSKRNWRLRNRSLNQSSQATKSHRQTIIVYLDSLYDHQSIGKIAGACLRVTGDYNLLVRTCIEWSSSVYRHGRFRAYAAARLLRIWKRKGVDLQGPIFNFLAASPDVPGLQKRDVYRLLAELFRSQHMSVSKYLQWLIARGTLDGYHDPNMEGPCDVYLLFELPLQGLPSHVLNLRSMLLTTLGVPAERERDMIIAAKAKILSQVPGFFLWDASSGSGAGCDEFALLSQTVKSAVALWIRKTLFSRLQVFGRTDSASEDTKQPNRDKVTFCLVTLEQFHAIRRILEDFEDFAILADVLNILSDEVQGPILTAVTDTVNQYYDVFNAIGAADDTFRRLYQRVEESHGPEVVENAFLESLIDLASRFPNAAQEVQRLRNDTLALVPRSSVVAFSPISDNMVEAAQSAEPTFADEMDQILAGGTSMDKQTLSRMFGAIIGHLETSFEESSQLGIRFSRLLARLRRFGPKTFDALLKDWLQKWLRSSLQAKLGIILPPMICSKVVSLKVVLDSTAQLLVLEDHRNDRATLAFEMLDMVITASSGPMPIVNYRGYRLLDQFRRLIRVSSASITTLLSVVVETCRATEAPLRTRARARVGDLSVRNLIQTLVLQQPSMSRVVASALPNTDLQTAFGGVLDQDQDQLGESSNLDRHNKISGLLHSISDFNVPLVQLQLRAILSDTGSLENAEDTLSDIIVEQNGASSFGRVELWACLVSELPVPQAASVREKAETEILCLVVTDATSMCHGDKTRLDGLTAIVEAAGFSVSDAETSPFLDQIADGLSLICSSHQLDKYQHDHDEIDSDHMGQCIDVLISLLIIHQSTIQHPRFSQSALFQVLISLSRLLIHPFLTFHPTLPSYVFDTLALLSDSLSDDTRMRCIRTLRDHHHSQDARLRFIFGYPETVNSEWLQLLTKPSTIAEAKSEGVTMQPYSLRRWEMMQDATPVSTENDTSLSLTLFGARKSVL